MDKKKAKLIFKHNYFEIVEDGSEFDIEDGDGDEI